MRWLWYFIIYSFCGFLLEVAFARAIRHPKRDRKCLLLLPLCPVYGLGMLAVLALPENKGKLAFLGRVKDARFKRQVVPGDVVELECRLTRQKGPIGVGECIAKVDGETAVTAELTFAIGAE